MERYIPKLSVVKRTECFFGKEIDKEGSVDQSDFQAFYKYMCMCVCVCALRAVVFRFKSQKRAFSVSVARHLSSTASFFRTSPHHRLWTPGKNFSTWKKCIFGNISQVQGRIKSSDSGAFYLLLKCLDSRWLWHQPIDTTDIALQIQMIPGTYKI